MSDLPTGWEWATFSDVAHIASNLVDPADHPTAPHIAPNHIQSATGKLLPFQTISADGMTSNKHRFYPGQILYSKIRPYLAKVVSVDFSGLCSADMYPIDSYIDTRYLKWWMLTPAFTEAASKHQGRSVLPKINAKALAKLPVPVPPLTEQLRIVDALEDHLSRLEAGLGLARRGQMRLAALAKRAIVEAVPVPCPDHWQCRTVGEAGLVDLGRQRHPDWHTGPNMRPYLRVANVFENRVDFEDVKEMDFPPDMFDRFKLHPGDILLNEGQSPEYLGRPAMYRGKPDEYAFTNSLLRFRARADVLPEWALLVFRRHMHARRFIQEVRITTNIAHLSSTRFKSVEFPIPPLDEQKRIVHEIDELLDDIARMSVALDIAGQRAQRLRQSLLADAFAGRLGPRSPSDEPASVLLERIRAERAAKPKANLGRRSRTAEAGQGSLL